MDMLDLAWEARKKGQIFNPLFTGEAGLGKSAIVKEWVDKQRKRNPNFFFLDLRVAYMEAPDMIGFPETSEVDGFKRTCHFIPEFWPDKEISPDMEGLILFEEPNRGTTGVMNCLMQILTDRQVHKLKIPDGVMFAACINPDSAEYDVNHMDAALKNRFEEFEVEYDPMAFINYMDAKNWDADIQHFVGSGTWIYKPTSEIKENGKYISPRTWEKVQAATVAGVKDRRALHRDVMCSILGREIGNEFHKFCYEEAPVTAQDLLSDKKSALKRLKKHSDTKHYKGDMIAITIESIVQHYGGLPSDCPGDKISEDVMAEVAKIIPSDQAVNLLKGCGFKQKGVNISMYFKDFTKRHPDLVDILRGNIVVDRAVKKK
ncbi:MAG: hypothetical protein HWN81_00195 [Candidatus Lokiarchaeota archaeon]|nr:hypothetical protein [Candidatus Lokiarchaeota archaeon]